MTIVDNKTDKYRELTRKSLATGSIASADILWIMENKEIEILLLLHAAFQVRSKFFGKKVKLHIINNVQSGNCYEDCAYCAQSNSSGQSEDTYPMKNEEQLFEEAKLAYHSGAFRHCLVFSGSKQSNGKVERLCKFIEKIKSKYPMEICVSMGFLNKEQAEKLSNAGVNRYNHNLNSSRNHYKNICSTHDFSQRLDTIYTAKAQGLQICSGVIIGMGESPDDLISITRELKKIEPSSVPINFFIPTPGHQVKKMQQLTPDYCLRILTIFRFCLPSTEIRIAGGREYHLGSLQALSLFPADSLFAKGYLTTGGDSVEATKKMIREAGFELEG